MTDDPAALHHRYQGDDLRRYRIALYAQWLAQRDGITIPDDRTHPDRIGIHWDDDNRPRVVTFYGPSDDICIRLPNPDRQEPTP